MSDMKLKLKINDLTKKAYTTGYIGTILFFLCIASIIFSLFFQYLPVMIIMLATLLSWPPIIRISLYYFDKIEELMEIIGDDE